MTRRNIVHVAILIVVLIALSSYGTMTLTTTPEGEKLVRSSISTAHFHLKTELPTYDFNTINVYEIVSEDFNPKLFDYLANKFDLQGEPEYTNNPMFPNTYILKENNGKFLRYHTETGTWIFTNPKKAYPTVEKEPKLPSDAEAVDIAEQFLKENGFWSNNLVHSIVYYQTQGLGIKGTEKVISEWILTKDVYFDGQLDGVSITGEKITISIGEGGEIVAFILPQRTYRKIGTTTFITSMQAYKDLQSGKLIYNRRGVDLRNRDIDIENVYLSYHIDSLYEDTGAVSIYYVFTGQFQDTTEEFSAYVDAIKI